MNTLNDLNLNYRNLENSIKTTIVLTILVIGIALIIKEAFFTSYIM